MVQDTEDKKGFWNTWLGKTVSFVGKYTGISWILGKISSGWNSVKGWFSSNGATKAGDADQSKSETLNNGKENPAPGLDNGQGRTAQVQNPDKQDKANGLSATDSLVAGGPAKPTPNNGTSATPLSGPAGPDNGEESDMQETKQNPVKPNPTAFQDGPANVNQQQKFVGSIKISDNGKRLVLVVPKDHVLDANPGKPLEYIMYIAVGKNKLRITGINPSNYSSTGPVKDDGYKRCSINSVVKGDIVCGDDNLKGMKDLVGLNETAPMVEITEISNVPFEAPEVKSPKTPERTTESGSEVKPEMKKESEAKESANVVDTGSTQEDPQPQPQGQEDSKGGTGTAGPEVAPAPTSLVTEGNPQPEVSGAATVKSESEVKATEPEPKVESTEGQDNSQQAKGAGTVVDGKDSSPKAAESSTEQPAATGAPAGGQFLDKQSEAKDKGQEEGQKVESNPEPAAVGEAGQQDKEGNPVVTPPVTEKQLQPEGGPEATPSEPTPTPAEAPFSQTTGPKSEHVPTNGKSGPSNKV